NGFFTALANQVGQGTAVNQLPGQGATTHTVMTVQPRGGQPSSQAVQGSWAMQKLKAGVGATSSGPGVGAPGGGLRDSANPLVAFIDGFATSIGQNGPLAAQWQRVQSGAQSLGQASSVAQFFTSGVAELLNILALVLDGVLAISQAFLDGLLAQIAALVT